MGTLLGLNKYDEFGNPQAGNLGVFGYTGQAWLPTVGLWYYKARAYDPELGRFLQTDPIGYEGGPNLYAYVGNDPVNLTDPLGLQTYPPGTICGPDPNANAVCGLGSALGTGGSILGSGGVGASGAQVSGNSSLPPAVDDLPDVTVVGERRPAKKLAQTVVVPRVGPPPSIIFTRPPWWVNKPPGWNKRWTWQRSPHRPGDPEPRWIDPKGGEWRWHGVDKYHDRPHWDYNPRNPVSSRWQHIYGEIV